MRADEREYQPLISGAQGNVVRPRAVGDMRRMGAAENSGARYVTGQNVPTSRLELLF